MPPDVAPAVATEAPAIAPTPAPAPEPSDDALMAQALKDFAGTPEAPPEPTKVEPPPAPAPAPEDTPPADAAELSKAFAAYKAKMKRFTAERAEFAEKQKQSEARQAELDARQAKLDEIEAEGRKNPILGLERMGFTKDQVLEFLANDGKVPLDVVLKNATAEQQKKLDDIQKRIDERDAELKKRDEAVAAAQRQEQLRGFERQAGEAMVDVLVKEGAAKYPILLRVAKKAGRDALMQVLDRMAEHYKKTQNTLALTDAMMQAESALKAHAAIFVDEQPSPAAKADPRQAGAVEPANPGNIEPISAQSANRRGVLMKKNPDDMTDDERLEVATAQLSGAAE